MKRSRPLRRSPLKRTSRLRQRSKTNSRPNLDEPLRRRYLEQNPHCELAPILVGARIASLDKVWQAWNEPDPAKCVLDPNHIFSMGSRPDVWSNLIALCRPVHDWFHANLIEGRICCLYVKAVIKDECDLAELDAVFGQSVLGWLENHPVAEPLIEKLRLETVAFLKEKACR